MFYVYIVASKRDGTIYTGSTDDLELRASARSRSGDGSGSCISTPTSTVGSKKTSCEPCANTCLDPGFSPG
jgi:hypothetical protein